MNEIYQQLANEPDMLQTMEPGLRHSIWNEMEQQSQVDNEEEATPLNSMGLSQNNFGPSRLSKHYKIANPASRSLRKTFQSSSPSR